LTIEIKNLDARQRATLWDAINPDDLSSAVLYTKGQITKDDWAGYWGNPCEWYVLGCVICDRWKLWTELTGETIEYELHEEDCECNECPTVGKKIVYATVKLVLKETADIEDVSQEADYGFNHPDILSTEWMECDNER
jgi:hypothetical protein